MKSLAVTDLAGQSRQAKRDVSRCPKVVAGHDLSILVIQILAIRGKTGAKPVK
jgi:hypothetical protein